jgi:hypothetical protein
LSSLFSAPHRASGSSANNTNPFSTEPYRGLLVKISMVLAAFVIILPLLFFIRRHRDKHKAGGLALAGIIASCISGLLAVILIAGLMKYGFFIRYGFSLSEKLLYVIPYIIIALLPVQLMSLFFCWKKGMLPIIERTVYLIYSAAFTFFAYELQAYCWKLF